MRKGILLLVAAAGLFLPGTGEAQRAVFVVRHAEKQSESSEKEIPLSEAGRQRATRLAQLLRSAGITAVYATDTVRTRQTAEPLAREASLPIKNYDVRDAKGNMTAEPLAARLKAEEKDGVVLVVGHSNTVPDVLTAFGHPETVRLGPDDYDDLFLVVPQPSGRPVVLKLKF